MQVEITLKLLESIYQGDIKL